MSSVWSDRPFLIVLAAVLAVALLLVISVAVPFGLSAYLANAIGQLAAFAVLALSLDLIWGYLGILSLGHGLFFGIGGYVVAMAHSATSRFARGSAASISPSSPRRWSMSPCS